jgi:hypothetical protein
MAIAIKGHPPLTDDDHFIAAQIVPAAVDDDLMCQALRGTVNAARVERIESGAFPAFNPGVGVDTIRFTDADIVVQRSANELVAQRRQQLLCLPPASELTDRSDDR